MSTERDELDELHRSIVKDAKERPEYQNPEAISGYSEGAEHAIETMRLRGYRKPRTITTADELDTLPGWSVVEAWGLCFVRSSTHETCWVSTTGHYAYSSAALIENYDSATVLHEAAS